MAEPENIWNELPAFEVRNPDTGHVFRIWYDGRIEGFPDGSCCVMNRIAAFMALFAGSVVAAEMGEAAATEH